MAKSLKNVKQDKETLKEMNLNVSLLNLMKHQKITRKELKEFTGLNDNNARDEVRKIALFYPVSSYTGSNGYRVIDTKKVTEDEYLDVIEEINRTINEQLSRIKVLKKRMKPLIACKKVLEKKFGRKEKENE